MYMDINDKDTENGCVSGENGVPSGAENSSAMNTVPEGAPAERAPAEDATAENNPVKGAPAENNAPAGNSVSSEDISPEETAQSAVAQKPKEKVTGADGDCADTKPTECACGDDGADNPPTDDNRHASKGRKTASALFAMLPPLACLAAIIASVVKTIPSGAPWLKEYYIYFGIMCVILTGSVLLGVFRPKIHGAVGWIVWSLAPAGAMLMAEWILRNPFDGKMTTKVIFLNIAVYYIVSLLTLFITRRTWLSTVITTAIPIIYSIINHYVMAFRGNALFPWDFGSVNTALSVASNYTFDFGFVMALVIVTFIFVYQLAYFARVRIMKSRVKMIVSFVLALIPLGMLFSYAGYLRTDKAVSDFRLYPYLFTPNSVYKRNGIAVSFFFSLKFMDVDKPEGYSPEKVEEFLAEYEQAQNSSGGEDETLRPNIIAIMNEAYSDLSVLGDFTTNTEVLPVTSRLTENTVKGQLYVSVVGGNTANSEFEFLCGSSMAFLPPGSVAYQQFLKHETPGLVSHLESLGYKTAAMHPYGASGWDRNKVYPLLGFDEMYFLSDFTGAERIRGYVSDRATFEKIIDLYENKSDGSPMFIFDVTMQNHGGYTTVHEDFPHLVNMDGTAYNSAISQYLSLIRESDIAFGELIDYFTGADEPTVILMFGDHQPGDSVVRPIYTQNDKPFPAQTLEEQQDRNIVPFFIWANFDIEERDDIVLSANYLSALLCETAGVELSAYQQYLSDLSKDYPVINANCFTDADGIFYPISDAGSEERISEYSMIQYNLLMDYKNRVTALED